MRGEGPMLTRHSAYNTLPRLPGSFQAQLPRAADKET